MFRSTLVALSILALSAAPSLAGLAPIGKEADGFAAFAALWTDIDRPLVDYGALELGQPDCQPARTPATHAILVASDNFVTDPVGAGLDPDLRDPRRQGLNGPANDVALVAATLAQRGVATGNMAILLGEGANRARLADAIAALLPKLSCNDSVIFHFTGMSWFPGDDWLGIGAPVGAALSDAIFREANAELAPDDAEARTRRAARWLPFLMLNAQADGALQAFNRYDLIEFVTQVRNRGAHMVVSLDTNWSRRLEIFGEQDLLAVSGRWTAQFSQRSGKTAPGEGIDGPTLHAAETGFTRLTPNAGPLSVFYGTLENELGIETRLPENAPDRLIFGVYSFGLGLALQTAERLDVRTLTERLYETSASNWVNQTARIEATDPYAPVIVEGHVFRPQGDAIKILAPTPKRGAIAFEEEVVNVRGRIDWPARTLVVFVDGQQARLAEDGTFEEEVALNTGLNRVKVFALTDDRQPHELTLEFLYEGDRKALEGEGRRYAVIIANQTYGAQTGMAALRTPFADAEALAAVLSERYGYETTAVVGGQTVPLFLKDASASTIVMTLFQLSQAAGENDSVLIYYAGHGIYEDLTRIAHWVPADAIAGVPVTYVSGSAVDEAIRRIVARNLIVISDSCYSGALLRGAPDAAEPIGDDDRTTALLRLDGRKSRILISSGNNEPVEDLGGDGHSVFAQALLTGLAEMEHEAFSARELFDRYILPMVVGRADQEPQYRPIEKSGHEGGDVVFVTKG